MSLYDYRLSRDIDAKDYPFAVLIMAAMRKADTGNARALRSAFPDICTELDARYNAPGGMLPSELPAERERYHCIYDTRRPDLGYHVGDIMATSPEDAIQKWRILNNAATAPLYAVES